MKKSFFTLALLFIIAGLNAQTLTEKQMQNARATGYSVVAAQNPGIDFSIYMIPWDGEKTLEENANEQINSGWHAQAVVKGNYFYQTFDGSDFTKYSTVLLSQEEFDKYKDKGTQWWIVCSTLPPFSKNYSKVDVVSLVDKQMQNARATGYSVVAAKNPGVDFSIYMIPWDGKKTLEENANAQINSGWHAQAVVKGNYFYQTFDGSDFTKYSTVLLSQEEFDKYKDKGTQWWIVCSTLPPFSEKVNFSTNVGIGTKDTKGYQLAIAGKAIAEEVHVELESDWPDYVFTNTYQLPKLEDVEKQIKRNGHLKNIPSAKEVAKNGISLGEMNAKLLQKIEELTLYTIEQEKRINSIESQNEKLEQENQELKSLAKRLAKIELQLENNK